MGDELHAAALWATESDQQAAECVRQTWSRLLRALQGRRFREHLRPRTFKILAQTLTDAVGAEPAQRAVDLVAASADEDSKSRVPAPPDLLDELVEETRQAAPDIAGAARARRQRRWLALAGAGLVIVVLMGIVGGLWSRDLTRRSSEIQFQCLRQRIIQADLMSTLHDAYAELADPAGADRLRAEAYQRIGLILEEIANAADLADLQHLRYIKQRIDSGGLLVAARAAAGESSDHARPGLMHALLVLEEVENL